MRTMPDNDRLPAALYRAEQVRGLDRTAIEQHRIPGIELMGRAGAAAYALLRSLWPDGDRITVLVGGGNNGGDGYIVARLAHQDGLAVRVLHLADPARLRGDALAAHDAYVGEGGVCEPFSRLPRRPGVVVDALLGTGLERPVSGDWARAIDELNATRVPVLAIDIPSGLHANTGAVLGTAVRAQATISFIGLKRGLFTGAGPDHCGAIRFSALDVPAVVYSKEVLSARRIDWAQQSSALPPRRRAAHKGDFGHVLVVGGAPGMSGAVRLAGEAALRAGAGLVTIATHPGHAAFLNMDRPELMVHGVQGPDDLAPLLDRADALVLGPGLGRGDWGRALWRQLERVDLPAVVDADALNLAAESPQAPSWDGLARVATPHPGEAARLLGAGIAEVEADRFASARRLADALGSVLVLKGAGSVIQGRSHRPPAVCSDGNPGMATAGSGDVLSGVIAAMMAQGLEPEEAACSGVCLHAAAGDRAARDGEKGMLAGDIIAALRAALRPVANGVGTRS
jgi:ADP-dependent NAD(P)H-hydrate dehydratase / NAD(P)H-hydrate epimerase